MKPNNRFETFFNAQSVAFVGASEKGLYPSGILSNLIEKGYPGKIFVVNPNREQVFGLPSFPSLCAIPDPVDLAIIVVRRDLVFLAIQDCAKKMVRSVLIISAGFAEQDQAGKLLQEEIKNFARLHHIHILGPNCAGYAAVPERLIATRLPVLPLAGHVSFVSGSGALMMALLGLFVDRKIGLNRLVSVGNQIDITLGEVILTFAEDQSTRVIGAFVEGITDGQLLIQAFERALWNGKPVVLVKSGKTSSGQQAAATHTAAIAGSALVFDAVCDQFGVTLVDDVQPLMDVLQIQAAFGARLKDVRRFMVVTQSGGMGSLTVDFMEVQGLTLAELGVDLINNLKGVDHLRTVSAWRNPADVRGTSLRNGLTRQTLQPFLADRDSDMVFILLARTAIAAADLETAQGIILAVQESDKPVIVIWVGQRIPLQADQRFQTAEGLLREAGIPVFDQSSSAINALVKACRYWEYRQGYLKSKNEVTQ